MNTGNHRENSQKDHMFQTNSFSTRTFLFFSVILLTVALMSVALLKPQEARARVRLENICSIYGQKEVKLTGLGLVVGLNGTGDGGKNKPAMDALAKVLMHMNLPTDSADLRDAKNVAVVLIEATIPKTGLRRGQKIDCYVSSIMGAKSLRSGRLLIAPLQTAEIGTIRLWH
ncbi:MAG: flagellar basal body P-ring protein FlgI [Planctomycetes bacterium]|nr:flagellar basal body P-ring protein FlgI [Planctomycetota bacterium]